MEGIKLDLTILESRLLTALSENEYESDINLLRVKLKELEGVVRNQDEVNRRLIEENVFFKSKLLFLEKLVLNMSQDYQNKGSGISNPISIIEESPTRDNRAPNGISLVPGVSLIFVLLPNFSIFYCAIKQFCMYRPKL
jgi:hypothetical protein